MSCRICAGKKQEARGKSKQFALDIIYLCDVVSKNPKARPLSNQLIRSGTSVGANVREALWGQSRADFVAKLQIALKECAESEYWLELLIESSYWKDTKILNDCVELKKILIAALKTVKTEN